ncbi:MAG: hypothetical protein U1D67_04250 [Dehalococcoidia bacterium]|nr:hypothetical protein [Dehalococcoidia bacterium]
MTKKPPKKTIEEMNIEICQAMIALMTRITEQAKADKKEVRK